MKHFSFLVFILSTHLGYSQNLAITEDSISYYYNALKKAGSDSLRLAASEKMKGFFMDAFTDNAVFEYPFEKLNLCKITSADKRIRLINWNVSFDDGTHSYVCYVLIHDSKKKSFTWTELYDVSRKTEKVETKFLTADKWYGALYYDIIPMGKKRKNDSYTLLGWDGNDRLSTRKIIDVLKINNGKLRFGDDLFKSEKKHAKRIIYEYSDEVSASVKYYQRKGHIVTDHLSARNPLMVGIYADYGPDGTYDRWVLKEGKWTLEQNIDISAYTVEDSRPFNLPKKN